MAELVTELRELLNRHSAEGGSNTPDWILATFLLDCLAAFDAAVLARASFYGRLDVPGRGHRIVATNLAGEVVVDQPSTGPVPLDPVPPVHLQWEEI